MTLKFNHSEPYTMEILDSIFNYRQQNTSKYQEHGFHEYNLNWIKRIPRKEILLGWYRWNNWIQVINYFTSVCIIVRDQHVVTSFLCFFLFICYLTGAEFISVSIFSRYWFVFCSALLRLKYLWFRTFIGHYWIGLCNN